ncbi:MAG: M28 family peptidase [Spirochaetes bacterium]|nr:M28 family peptidase [Spirochaetota bacterium]
MNNKFEADILAKEALDLTQKIIDECGPRLAGTEACRRSGEIIRKEMGKYCDRTEADEFEFHPMALLGFIRATTVAYVVSSLFLFFGYVIPAAIGYTFIAAISLSQFVFYLQIFDPIYKKAKGYNVYGVIEPAGEVKQQIIVSGHHDSAYVFNFFTKFPKLYRIRLILGILPMNVALFLAWTWVIMKYAFDASLPFADLFRYGAIASFIFVVPLYFFIGKNGTPGAGDNMIATAIALKIAGIFGNTGKKKSAALSHTRLIILSFDAEESGLRGARAYARRHRTELLAIPTYCFNMDSIYDLDKIKFLVRDINGFTGLSKKMARRCIHIAGRLGYRIKPLVMPFGGGGTDAAELAKVGVEATTLIAMPVSVERDAVVYHTPEDTVEHIQPQAVEAIIRILHGYILEMDGEA